MSPPQECPTQEKLSDYVLGKLSVEESDSLTDHLKDCDDCLSRIDDVDESADSMIYWFRHPTAGDDFINEPACQQAVADCGRLASESQANLGYVRDYRLTRKLGQGGMGTVYHAVHAHLNKAVAVKVLPPERTRSAEAVARFKREMQAVGKLDHPNIVRAQDAGEADGKHYLVMEYIDGLDLSAVAKHIGPLPVADACELVRQAALALKYVHENGMVHRDIKPANLMVTPAGQVKILDLGLALLSETLPETLDLTTVDRVMGTLDYMAPEQLGDSHAVDHRADIYSLGATLYRLLTGRAPYADAKYDTPMKKLMAIATKPSRPINEYRSDVPKGLIAILKKMFAKNPDDRNANAGEVVEALKVYAHGCDLRALLVRASSVREKQRDEEKASTIDHAPSAMMMDTTPNTTRSKSRPMSQTASWLPRRRQLQMIAIAACVFIAVFSIFYVMTNNGTLVVKVEDDDVEVKLRQHGLVVHDLKSGRQWTISTPGRNTLSPGEYKLTVTDDAGLKLQTKEFVTNQPIEVGLGEKQGFGL